MKIEYSVYLSEQWFQYLILHSFRVLLSVTEWIGFQRIRKEFLTCRVEEFIKAFSPAADVIPTLSLIFVELKRNLITVEGNLHFHHKSCAVGKWIERTLEAVSDNAYEFGKYGKEVKKLFNLNCCAYCYKGTIGTLKLCSKCKNILYCGRECQKAHYPIHKTECKPHN